MESRLRLKDIIGATQIDRSGLGTRVFKYFYKASEIERRGLVSEEIRVTPHIPSRGVQSRQSETINDLQRLTGPNY